MTSTIRETCRKCGESHITKVIGISIAENYAVVIDRCTFCEVRQDEIDAADAYAMTANGDEKCSETE